MKLRDWIRCHGITVPELAKSIGESDSLVRKWVYGQRQPSLSKAVAIELHTDGAVTARDLLLQTDESDQGERRAAA